MWSAASVKSPPPSARTPRPSQRNAAGRSLCAPGGVITERMIGWSVTTLTKIEMIQKLENTATFWMRGMGAIATGRMPMPSASTDAMAGGKRCEYDSTIA